MYEMFNMYVGYNNLMVLFLMVKIEFLIFMFFLDNGYYKIYVLYLMVSL